MAKCGCDLASYIAYMQTRQRKLTFLKKPIPEDELVSIFINGLHPVFSQDPLANRGRQEVG